MKPKNKTKRSFKGLKNKLKKMQSAIWVAFYLACITVLFLYRDNINIYIIENYVYTKQADLLINNDYAKNQSFEYVQTQNDLEANTLEEIINIVYTIIDSGVKSFTFYCDPNYIDCQNDIEFLSKETSYFNLINNFVHPYNSYDKLYISTNGVNKIEISIDKLYKEEEIKYINYTMEQIKEEILTENMTIIEKIKAFHDYIINTTKYDQETAVNIQNNNYFSENNSHKATGLLLNHLAICSGYTDIMSIFLSSLGVKNYKVATDNHIWNAIYLDEKWYHLDLTWDDPITNIGIDMLLDEFFIIDDETLKNKDPDEHRYNESIYKEIATSSN